MRPKEADLENSNFTLHWDSFLPSFSLPTAVFISPHSTCGESLKITRETCTELCLQLNTQYNITLSTEICSNNYTQKFEIGKYVN